MKKLFLLALIFFAGFFTHAYFSPNLLFYNKPLSLDALLKNAKTDNQRTKIDPFFTGVIYQKGQFSPQRVSIKKSNYITITNNSKTEGMWLISNNQLLNTSRPYYESEQLKTILNEIGSFTVINKVNPQAVLVVVVSP